MFDAALVCKTHLLRRVRTHQPRCFSVVLLGLRHQQTTSPGAISRQHDRDDDDDDDDDGANKSEIDLKRQW